MLVSLYGHLAVAKLLISIEWFRLFVLTLEITLIMKTRLFTLLAALLLTGISAFAQSVEPIKGDVNGDGRVNVADIASIIDITAKGEAGYFYFGNVRPTAENYTSLPGVIGSYTSISEASGATATIAAGETLYMMCPASWMEGKSVELEDESGNPISFLEEKDAITVSGYVIYRTQALNDEKTVVLKTTYKWHIGTTSPDKTSWSESDFNQTSQSPITSFNAVTSNPFTIWIVPNSWGTISSMKIDGETRNQWQTPVPWITSLPSGYTAYYSNFSRNAEITDITWSK